MNTSRDVGPTSFEEIVEKLRLSPSRYEKSILVKDWVGKNKAANTADLALVVEDHGAFYRASTCITLDMAYNNARQLARPDRDWLQP